jgi:myo-inositol catabolism protein IolC
MELAAVKATGDTLHRVCRWLVSPRSMLQTPVMAAHATPRVKGRTVGKELVEQAEPAEPLEGLHGQDRVKALNPDFKKASNIWLNPFQPQPVRNQLTAAAASCTNPANLSSAPKAW